MSVLDLNRMRIPAIALALLAAGGPACLAADQAPKAGTPLGMSFSGREKAPPGAPLSFSVPLQAPLGLMFILPNGELSPTPTPPEMEAARMARFRALFGPNPEIPPLPWEVDRVPLVPRERWQMAQAWQAQYIPRDTPPGIRFLEAGIADLFRAFGR